MAASGPSCDPQDLRCGSSRWGVRGQSLPGRLSCPAACEILVPRSGIEPSSPALEGRFLTTGPPGRVPGFLNLVFIPTLSSSFFFLIQNSRSFEVYVCVFVLGGGDWTRLGSEKRQGGKREGVDIQKSTSPSLRLRANFSKARCA